MARGGEGRGGEGFGVWAWEVGVDGRGPTERTAGRPNEQRLAIDRAARIRPGGTADRSAARPNGPTAVSGRPSTSGPAADTWWTIAVAMLSPLPSVHFRPSDRAIYPRPLAIRRPKRFGVRRPMPSADSDGINRCMGPPLSHTVVGELRALAFGPHRLRPLECN